MVNPNQDKRRDTLVRTEEEKNMKTSRIRGGGLVPSRFKGARLSTLTLCE